MSVKPDRIRPQSQPATERSGESTVDPSEIAKFAAMAEAWWDPLGKFMPLHKLNPVRVAFVRDLAMQHFGRSSDNPQPLEGLSLLDIGCGGGLLSEPMARLGATVTGIDAAEKNIQIARAHAEKSGLPITYLACASEDLVARKLGFDIVLAMEVVEHVANLDAFVANAAELVKPEGLLFIATINRTAKSFALAIVGAEYVLRWLPRGTHDWRRFVRPSELARALRPTALTLKKMSGVSYNPLADRWSLSRDIDVNYMLAAGRY